MILVLGLAALAPAAPGAVVRVEHRDPSALPSRGAANALVTIEVFFAPGANSRSPGYRMLEQFQERHPSRVRLVYRIVKSGNQTRTPYAALEAHAQGKFFDFMDALNSELARTGRGGLTDKELVDVAKRVGVDVDRFADALRGSDAYDKVLDANERRRTLRFRGPPATPNVLFNGRAPDLGLAQMKMDDLEREYRAAKDVAEDLLDRGADRGALAQALDQASTAPKEIRVLPSRTDEEIGEAPLRTALATPPLDLRGLPAYGPAEVATTIAILCSPTSSNCIGPIRTARLVQELYPDQVRVVWAPYYDVARDDAADLSLLADAALCAEKVGTRAEDRDSASLARSAESPGWRWVEAVLAENGRRRLAPDKLIDRIADKLRVDTRAFATCRAQLAGASIAWIEAARRAGVRTSPSTVVGGRIYGPIDDRQMLQWLVDAELVPGLLGEAAPTWTRPEPSR